MKKFLSITLAMVMVLALFSGCASTQTSSEASAAGDTGKPAQQKTLGITIPQNAEYFQFISESIKTAAEQAGIKVNIMSADNDGQLMQKQIQNFTVSKVDMMYMFPAGDASAFHDVVKAATDAGIKTVVSHNSTGEGTATSIIQCDELSMGMMMSAMVDEWVDKTFPDAAPQSIKVLTIENSLIPDMIKRSAGMKLVGEKFLRKIDMATARYIKTEGPEASYLDEAGQKIKVDEPTGGLVLDKDGNAILNPYYNEKVKIIEHNNRTIGNNMDAQKALDIVLTANNGENKDIKVVACYAGNAAAGASEKLLSMKASGVITEDLSKLACFGSDITPLNLELIKKSNDNTSLFRGVMTNGDIVGTIVNTILSVAEGKDVPADQWEPIGYMTLNDEGTDVRQVMYDNSLPEAAAFLG